MAAYKRFQCSIRPILGFVEGGRNEEEEEEEEEEEREKKRPLKQKKKNIEGIMEGRGRRKVIRE